MITIPQAPFAIILLHYAFSCMYLITCSLLVTDHRLTREEDVWQKSNSEPRETE